MELACHVGILQMECMQAERRSLVIPEEQIKRRMENGPLGSGATALSGNFLVPSRVS